MITHKSRRQGYSCTYTIESHCSSQSDAYTGIFGFVMVFVTVRRAIYRYIQKRENRASLPCSLYSMILIDILFFRWEGGVESGGGEAGVSLTHWLTSLSVGCVVRVRFLMKVDLKN